MRLLLTIVLGAYFIYIQFEEYTISLFTIADGIYGSIFYIATGFHGIHVLIGTCFLRYILINLINGKLLFNHHFSFEAAA
jgi:heme/copper-type cytochrome/quinol oxidase subunit 3